MPTGRLTFPGGLSHIALQVPRLPGSPSDTRDNALQTGNVKPVEQAQPTYAPSYGALEATQIYGRLSVEVAKANFLAPTNQGHRAAISSRGSMMYDPRNNPSRSQFQEGYTAPLQLFAASNTYNTPNGATVKSGIRAQQPSTKFVSPFSTLPIPTRMPWDL